MAKIIDNRTKRVTEQQKFDHPNNADNAEHLDSPVSWNDLKDKPFYE